MVLTHSSNGSFYCGSCSGRIVRSAHQIVGPFVDYLYKLSFCISVLFLIEMSLTQ